MTIFLHCISKMVPDNVTRCLTCTYLGGSQKSGNNAKFKKFILAFEFILNELLKI